jgi:hypothetical protein
VAGKHRRRLDAIQPSGGLKGRVGVRVVHVMEHLRAGLPGQRMACGKAISDGDCSCRWKEDRGVPGRVPRYQDGLRTAGQAAQYRSVPRPGLGCRPCSERSGFHGVEHPPENAGAPCTDEDLAERDLVLLFALDVGQLFGRAKNGRAVRAGEVGSSSGVVDVAVRDEYGPGIGRLQSQVPDLFQHLGAIGGVAAVDEHKTRRITDHDPVRGWPLDEEDARRLLGNAGGRMPAGGCGTHGLIVAAAVVHRVASITYTRGQG